MTTYEDRPDIVIRTVDGADECGGSGGVAGVGGHGRLPAPHAGVTRGGRTTRRPRRLVHDPAPVDGAAAAAHPAMRRRDGDRAAARAESGWLSDPPGPSDPAGPPSPRDRWKAEPGHPGSTAADDPGAAGASDDDGTLAAVRAALATAGSCRASLLMVADHRTDRPRVFTAPVDLAFAGQLLDLALEVADQAVDAEWRPVCPGFAPSSGQWLWTPTMDTALAALDEEVCRPTHPPYQRSVDFGRSNLLVLRVRRTDGGEALRLYQSLLVAHTFLYAVSSAHFPSEPFLPEHADIIAALTAGDVPTAGMALTRHLQAARDRAIARVDTIASGLSVSALPYMQRLG